LHELSLAMNIIEMAEEEVERRGGVHVTAIHLKLGLLAGVVKAALLSCYEIACDGTSLEGSSLLIEEVPVLVFCSRCQAQRPVSSIQLFCCAECSTPTAEVVQGKEIEVVALEIEPWERSHV
jgi:hydrogenase nickel incorporation protein HypA/HybF